MKIVGTQTWHLHVIGEVPAGIKPEMVEPVVLANYAILGAILPQVRGQFVVTHEVSPEVLKDQLAAQYKKDLI